MIEPHTRLMTSMSTFSAPHPKALDYLSTAKEILAKASHAHNVHFKRTYQIAHPLAPARHFLHHQNIFPFTSISSKLPVLFPHLSQK